MQPNLNSFERIVRFIIGVIAFITGAIIFSHPIARIAAVLFGVFAFGEAVLGKCVFYRALGLTNSDECLKPATASAVGLALIQMIIGYEWLSAGWEKIFTPDFILTMNKTLAFFASKNPFPWYKNFLLNTGTANAIWFGYAVTYGEIIVGAILILSAVIMLLAQKSGWGRTMLSITILGLLGGLAMNANFYFAGGWTGAGTHAVNVIMFWTQAILLYLSVNTLLSIS